MTITSELTGAALHSVRLYQSACSCMASKLSVSLPDVVSSTDALTCSQASSSSLICAVAQLPSSQAGGLNSASSAHVLHDGHHEDVLTGDFVASRFRCSHAKRILIKVGTRVATRALDERLALGRLGAVLAPTALPERPSAPWANQQVSCVVPSSEILRCSLNCSVPTVPMDCRGASRRHPTAS